MPKDTASKSSTFKSLSRRLFGSRKVEMKKKLPQIVLFGDSLTEWAFDEMTAGFGWVLEKKYHGKAEIVNEGDAGNTSTGLQRSFAHIISRATKPDAPPTLLVTIFLGANDACILPEGEYVPLPKFTYNIREFVEIILTEDDLLSTKIVLITPPPINIPDPFPEDEDEYDFLSPAAAAALKSSRKDPKEDQGYKTYMSKKRYAEKIMEIAQSYEDTGRVVGFDYWKSLVDKGLEDQGRHGDDDAYDEERLPGCGLKRAKEFGKGYFTDGLHLGARGYDVLSTGLLELVLKKWPELEPEKIEV